MADIKPLNIRGFDVYQSYLDAPIQQKILTEVRKIVAKAPMYSPQTAWGKPMSVQMTSAGRFGWYSDRQGYRYEPLHPNGTPWPQIPQSILDVWIALVGGQRMPDCCLINHYRENARMGLHQDNDEADFGYPVLSISLGDEALFRVGGTDRKGSTQSIWLRSGDVCVMGGDARLAYHGVDRIRFGSSTLLSNSGRVNLTLRVVD